MPTLNWLQVVDRPTERLEFGSEQKTRNDQIVEALRVLFESSPVALRRPLNDSFYESVLRRL
jgi:hypothetical protein